VVDPKKRLNANEILKHPWVIAAVTPRKHLTMVVPKIKEWNAKRKFKRAQMLVLAATRFKSALKGLMGE